MGHALCCRSHQVFLPPPIPRFPSMESRILFSAERDKGDSWQIWEMAADGSGLRQITHCEGDCLQPKYLPQNQIVYTSVSGTGAQRRSAVYVSQIGWNGRSPDHLRTGKLPGGDGAAQRTHPGVSRVHANDHNEEKIARAVHAATGWIWFGAASR